MKIVENHEEDEDDEEDGSLDSCGPSLISDLDLNKLDKTQNLFFFVLPDDNPVCAG